MRPIDKTKFPNHYKNRLGVWHFVGPVKRLLKPLTDDKGRQYIPVVDKSLEPAKQTLTRLPL